MQSKMVENSTKEVGLLTCSWNGLQVPGEIYYLQSNSSTISYFIFKVLNRIQTQVFYFQSLLCDKVTSLEFGEGVLYIKYYMLEMRPFILCAHVIKIVEQTGSIHLTNTSK